MNWPVPKLRILAARNRTTQARPATTYSPARIRPDTTALGIWLAIDGPVGDRPCHGRQADAVTADRPGRRELPPDGERPLAERGGRDAGQPAAHEHGVERGQHLAFQ